MKKLIGFVFLLTLTSCSYVTDFYIFNNTEQPVLVEYQIKEQSTYELFVIKPRICEFNKNKEILKIIKTSKPKVDKETNIVICKLEKGQALWIGDDLNFTLNNPDEKARIGKNLKYLKIKTKATEINADEYNVAELFETFKRSAVGIELE